jgi:cell division protein FtsL
MQIAEKKEKFPRKYLFNEKILTFLLLLMIVLLSVPLYNNFHRRQKINREISDLEAEINQAENKNTELQKLIKYLESDQFVEEQARLNLNMKKPGESVTVVKDLPESAKDSGTQSNASAIPGTGGAAKTGFAAVWWNYFLKANN